MSTAPGAVRRIPNEPPELPDVGEIVPRFMDSQADADAPHTFVREATGWEPLDLAKILAGGTIAEPPSLCLRSDDVPIFYAGRLHSLQGEPETLKSWGAQLAAAQVMCAGGDVVYVDLEDSPEAIVGRLLALGVPVDGVRRHLLYVQPERTFTVEAGTVLDELLAERPPTLAVVDGITEAMALLGLDPLDNRGFATFHRTIISRFVRAGAATLIIDHVTKDRETRGRWAIGAQHKQAIASVVIGFETLHPFGVGQTGVARLTLHKDKPGHLRQHAAGKHLANLELVSHPDGSITGTLRPPDNSTRDGDHTFRPTVLMERMSRAIEAHPGLSQRGLLDAVKGNRDGKRLALELLIAEGFVALTPEGRSHVHTSVQPYRQAADESTPECEHA